LLCVYNKGSAASLQLGTIYRQIRSRADDSRFVGWVRVVDESGEDYLFPGTWFEQVDISTRGKKSVTQRLKATLEL